MAETIRQHLEEIAAGRIKVFFDRWVFSGGHTCGDSTFYNLMRDNKACGTAECNEIGSLYLTIDGREESIRDGYEEVSIMVRKAFLRDDKQIAEKLYISEGTVKNYISVIYDKTGIHDRVQLAIALRN